MSGEKELSDSAQNNRALSKLEHQVSALSLFDACKVTSSQKPPLRFVQIDWQSYTEQFGLSKKDSVWNKSQGRLKEDLFTITRYYEMIDLIVQQYVAREQKAFKGCGCYNCLREHRLITQWYVTPDPDLV